MPSTKAGKPKNFIVWLFILVVILVMAGVGFQVSRIQKGNPPSESPSPTPAISQSIDGIYKGNLPCADCSGIAETLILAKDGSYIMEDLYQGKSVKPFQSQGKWEKSGPGILKLAPADDGEISYFQIIENGNLQMLDSNMQKIDSPFNQTLTKEN